MCGMDRGDRGGAEFGDEAKQYAWEVYWGRRERGSRGLTGQAYAGYARACREQFEVEWQAGQGIVAKMGQL